MTWEKWNGQDSRNHPMFGGALMWYYNTLAGINPLEDAPGFRRFVVKPYPAAGLSGVSYSLETPYGEAASEVSCGDGATALTVTVPVGSEAEIWVPLPSSSARVTLADGTPVVGQQSPDGRWFVTRAPQGRWSFSAR